ncbi:hypothetical protein AwErysi_02380 [Erysipelotrichaceae bacterium]|nr:hypothetical protein AwErysi_02380 [Erysipelotrichaceae bacterium]
MTITKKKNRHGKIGMVYSTIMILLFTGLALAIYYYFTNISTKQASFTYRNLNLALLPIFFGILQFSTNYILYGRKEIAPRMLIDVAIAIVATAALIAEMLFGSNQMVYLIAKGIICFSIFTLFHRFIVKMISAAIISLSGNEYYIVTKQEFKAIYINTLYYIETIITILSYISRGQRAALFDIAFLLFWCG